MYNAGGSPKVAEKQFEADLSKASAKIKSEVPGRTNQAQKEGEKFATEAGAKVDSYVSDGASQQPSITLLTHIQVEKTKAELAKAEGKLEQYSKDASKETMKKIDQADAKIEEASAKAKSGISSWFGGK